MILGIDPGPTSCGVVAYAERRAVLAHKNATIDETIEIIQRHRWIEVVIERVQSYGIAGGSLLRTSETVGRLWQAAAAVDVPVILVYRREVLRALDVTGRGTRDALVRARLLEMHGGTRAAAVGRKAAPGPLYGVSGHAWAALAVLLAAQLPGVGERV